MLKAGQRSRTQIAWMNFIAVSHSWCRSPSSAASCLPAVSLSPLSRSPTDCLRFLAHSHTHAHTRTDTQAARQTDATQWLGEREGGSLALNNTDTVRLANGMERVGLNLSGRSGGGVMSAPTQLQPLAKGILATVWSIHTSLLPEGDGWRVLGVLVQVAPWSNQGWLCEERWNQSWPFQNVLLELCVQVFSLKVSQGAKYRKQVHYIDFCYF